MKFAPTPPQLGFLWRAWVDVAAPTELGLTPQGQRRIIDIIGGRVEGDALSGVILPGGADWQLIRQDGTAVLEARYTIRANDGALIYVRNNGYRHGPEEVLAAIADGVPVDPARYYFRAAPVFETSAPRYAWLNKTLALSSGMREKGRVILDFYAVR